MDAGLSAAALGFPRRGLAVKEVGFRSGVWHRPRGESSWHSLTEVTLGVVDGAAVAETWPRRTARAQHGAYWTARKSRACGHGGSCRLVRSGGRCHQGRALAARVCPWSSHGRVERPGRTHRSAPPPVTARHTQSRLILRRTRRTTACCDHLSSNRFPSPTPTYPSVPPPSLPPSLPLSLRHALTHIQNARPTG